ncbi:DUF1638 domain-containing protein [Frigidibacter sp. MR17.24]|uniref:DUF1638 domain-containing protein n=1 Tax=Frigidibacter sp. MR17.24 TaxID=3127345 RepID=UPI003012AC0F
MTAPPVVSPTVLPPAVLSEDGILPADNLPPGDEVLPGDGVLPEDEILTRAGLAPAGRGRVLLIACGALAREILALKAANGWDHLDLTCLPANLHLWPDRITPAVRAAVAQHRAAYDRVFVVYADCGTGGLLQAACAEMGVEMVAGPHCYAFFDGNDAFAARAEEEIGAFYLTDFLVRQFDAFVWRPMGLDRHPQLRDMYFAHYDRLVFLAQTEDPALAARAEAAAARLGLRYERRFTGYGDLAAALAGA